MLVEEHERLFRYDWKNGVFCANVHYVKSDGTIFYGIKPALIAELASCYLNDDRKRIGKEEAMDEYVKYNIGG